LGSTSGHCLSIEEGSLALTNCEIHAAYGEGISWMPEPRGTAKLTNCVVTGETNILVHEFEDATLVLDHNTFFGIVTIGVMGDEDDDFAGRLTITANHNLFDAEDAMLLGQELESLDDQDFAEMIRWRGTGNLFPPTLLAIRTDDEIEPLSWAESLAMWSSGPDVSESGSAQRRAAYLIDRERLLTRLEEGQLSAADLKVRSTPGELTAGADVERVGPK